MPKPNKQNVIDEILIELEKGISYTNCLSVNGSKWQKPQRTFDRYWTEAQNQYQIRHQLINNEIIKQAVENKKEVLKVANLTKIDRILIAEKIAMGNAKKIDGIILVPSPSDQLKALDYLAKINSDYAPTKTDITTGGEKLNTSKPDLSKLSPAALDELINSFTDNGNDTE